MGQNPGDNGKIIKVPQEETFPTSGSCKWGDMWRAHRNDSLHLGFWHTKGPNAVMHLSLIAHLLSPAQEGQKQDVESGKEIKKENKSRSGQRLRKPSHPPIFQAFGPEWVSSWHGGMEGVVGTLKLDEKLKPWYRTGLDFLHILHARYFINAWEWWGKWGYAPKMSNNEEEQFHRGSVKGQWWERRKLLTACLFLIPACSVNCV